MGEDSRCARSLLAMVNPTALVYLFRLAGKTAGTPLHRASAATGCPLTGDHSCDLHHRRRGYGAQPKQTRAIPALSCRDRHHLKAKETNAMVNLNELSRQARSAAMRGGTAAWGAIGGLEQHIRYADPLPSSSRRRCSCGCKKRATHLGMANGVALISGCELSVRRWIKA